MYHARMEVAVPKTKTLGDFELVMGQASPSLIEYEGVIYANLQASSHSVRLDANIVRNRKEVMREDS